MLTLRSWADSQPVATDGAHPSEILGANPPIAQKDPAAGAPSHPAGRRGKGAGKGPQPPPTLAAEAPQTDKVEILRGDRYESRNFQRGEKR